ncbi:MAG TPA: hypothetical protein VGK73_33375, partial [Polyangiaceae bacterium]
AVARQAPGQSSEEPRTVDPVRGTIKGSTRYIGLGGAFVAIADDTEGVAKNPASAAVRMPYSWNAFSFSFGIDFSVGTWLPKNDLYNAPNDATSGSLFGSVAAVINYRHAGFGVAAEAEQNVVSRDAQGFGTDFTANFGLVHAVAAYGYFDGQLLLGAGVRMVGFSFDASESIVPLTAGIGYTAGLIVKPKHEQFRVGLSLQQPINAEFTSAPDTAPIAAEIPWAAGLGFAYQFGARPLNPPFVTAADRARRNARGREPTSADVARAEAALHDEFQKAQTWYLLVSTELALIEGGGDLALSTRLAVDKPLVSPRLGLESEVIPRWLRLRTGTYIELPIAEGGDTRVHGTGGVDIKLFRWDVFGLARPFDHWQLSLAADGAKAYLNTSFSIGFWH